MHCIRIYHWTVASTQRACHHSQHVPLCPPPPLALPFHPDASSTSSAVCQSLPEWRTSDQYEERRGRKKGIKRGALFPFLPLPSPTLISRQNPRLLCMKKIESSRSRRRRQYRSLFGVPCLDGSKLIPLEDRPLPFTTDPQIPLTFLTSFLGPSLNGFSPHP